MDGMRCASSYVEIYRYGSVALARELERVHSATVVVGAMAALKLKM